MIFESAAFVSITPSPREDFLEFYALGANGSASDYYPDNSSIILPQETVAWYLGVGNQMGSMQLADIRIKVTNETILAPNDTTLQSSPAPEFAEFKQFLADNETWMLPFVWKILNFTVQNGVLRLVQLEINNITYTLQPYPTCSTTTACRLRFIFELWTWNVDTADYQFSWKNGDLSRIAWLQLWFNISTGEH